MRLFRTVVLQLTPFWIQLCYFVAASIFGFGLLRVLKPRTYPTRPRNLDLFFTSVSATTVSSMSTVEIEVFSNAQLVVMALLMFSGGEVFLSMAGLFLSSSNKVLQKRLKTPDKMMDPVASNNDITSTTPTTVGDDHVELGNYHHQRDMEMKTVHDDEDTSSTADEVSRHRVIRFLGLVVLGYLIIVHLVGIATVLGYVTFVFSARAVLSKKGLHRLTFAVFTTVSTFTNCGFVPTNENMAVFAKDWGLLLLLIPQSLLGNTLFHPFLRAGVRAVGKFGFGTAESAFLLNRTREIGSCHRLLPSLREAWLVVATVAVLVLVQVVMFCMMEWDSAALAGLSRFQKLVGIVFQCVNSRHTGEGVVNLAVLSPAILILFVFMMYLPPNTSFLPGNHKEERSDSAWEGHNNKKGRGKVVESILFSQLSYLVIFVIVICITERRQMKEDPINFSALNIVVEVISAYANVGFSTGYSCELRLLPADARGCMDNWFGFSGKWTDEGKIVLMAVMLFGRLKKFTSHGGKAWKLC